MSYKREIAKRRQLAKLDEEKVKWMQKTFEEISKLGIGMMFENPYVYEIGEGDDYRHIEIDMIESSSDCYHLQISLTDNEPHIRILWFWPVFKTVVSDWKVYKDGRAET